MAAHPPFSSKARVLIENRQVDASLTLVRGESNLASSTSDFGLGLLVALVQ